MRTHSVAWSDAIHRVKFIRSRRVSLFTGERMASLVAEELDYCQVGLDRRTVLLCVTNAIGHRCEKLSSGGPSVSVHAPDDCVRGLTPKNYPLLGLFVAPPALDWVLEGFKCFWSLAATA